MQQRERPDDAQVTQGLVTLGEHIALWRKVYGLTQVQLAEQAGVTRTSLLRLEKGLSTTADTVFRVLAVLGLLDDVLNAVNPLEHEVGALRVRRMLEARSRSRDIAW